MTWYIFALFFLYDAKAPWWLYGVFGLAAIYDTWKEKQDKRDPLADAVASVMAARGKKK